METLSDKEFGIDYCPQCNLSIHWQGFPKEAVKECVRKLKDINPEHLASLFHRSYEFHSKNEGWETQENCRVQFEDLPEENKKVMILVCGEIIDIFLNKRIDKLVGPKLIDVNVLGDKK